MKIIKSSSLGNIQIFSLIVLFVTIISTICSHLFFNIDYCAKDRLFDKREKSIFHHLYLFISFGCVLLIAFQIIFWNPLKFKFNFKSLFLILHSFLWYGATYCICFLLKRILDDKTCNKSHNSVSGHFLFHTFYLIAVPYWFLTVGRLHNKNIQKIENKEKEEEEQEEEELEEDNSSPSQSRLNKRNQKTKKSPVAKRINNNKKQDNIVVKKNQIKPRNELLVIKRLLTENSTTILLIIPYIIYIYSSYINLEKTWVHGFHSIRQILYGLILSFFSLYSLLFITSKNNNLDKKSSCFSLIITLGFFWSVSLMLLNYYSVRIPFGMVELVLFTTGFIFLIYFSFGLPLLKTKKNKTD
ncbi:hypothetical protein DICPUDRAFT_151122 [Dictyostelium purpureum]|uniref:Uncharacterized protein n=1 Tax=Dictyostelium purpureum TaxID=5786 RepID=F0ZI17_DICPU|nr:uncharacterized protein DICPUDRAFT_151122 [Dictyostelium purpureum]EGC36433.1 hypothetical protein DICPUDRAFT_151122 [Dictyostelium purpureum]|eukprot:XP_003287066.1 hypothetical protein DICPUDRAFT_151122 [Dictyostelium purpureum]